MVFLFFNSIQKAGNGDSASDTVEECIWKTVVERVIRTS
jgi:hypothetical protein